MSPRRHRAPAWVLGSLLLVGVLTSLLDSPRPADPGHARTPVATAPALQALAGLAVKGRGPRTGYSRAAFGSGWSDLDRNGCDTRNDVLRRDLTAVTARAGTRGCVIVSGTLQDPYTDQVLPFAKEHATAVQIDHVVALSNAWQTGAQRWSWERRIAFANDPPPLGPVGHPAGTRGDAARAGPLPGRAAAVLTGTTCRSGRWRTARPSASPGRG